MTDSRLEGWKNIAAYLGVSVRTAQTFEKDRRLPVTRGIGLKSPVSALASELDLWKEAFYSSTEQPPDQVDIQDRVDLQQVRKTDRRQWLRYVSGITAAVSGFAGIAELRRTFAGRKSPRDFTVEGSTLIIYSADNAELWRHTFSVPLGSGIRNDIVPPFCIFQDVDDDGQIETLFKRVPRQWDGLHSLVCFDIRGEIKWEFFPGKRVVDNLGRDLTPPFRPNAFHVVRPKEGDTPVVIVSSHHYWSFPDQVAVLDGKTGRLISEYWHRGHLRQMVVTHFGSSDATSVILGGVNDAPDYKKATLVVFDGCRISGASRRPDGGTYFRSMNAGAERVVFFPRSPVNADQEFNHVVQLSVNDDRITVMVAEGIREDCPGVIYELSKTLSPVRTWFDDTFVQHYANLPPLRGSKRPDLNELARILQARVIVMGNS